MLRNTLRNIGWSLLSYWLGSPSLLGVFQYSQILLKHSLCRFRNRIPFQPKYWNYTDKLNSCKNRLQPLRKGFKRLIRYGQKTPVILLVFLSVPITGICQKDTLTTQELSNYYSLIGLINTDLKDYDLVKEKSAIQDKQLKGLQAISRKQQAISVRKEFQLDKYANQIIQLQTKTTTIQNQLSSNTKKLQWARVENWLWRGGAVIIIIKTLKLI